MDTFVRRNGITSLSNNTVASEKSIPMLVTKDCIIYGKKLEEGDIFIDPGVVIQQKDGNINGFRPNAFKMFSFKCESILTHFTLDSNKLFGLDQECNAHIFYTNGTTPESHNLKHKVLNWCIIPKTRIIISWNLLTMRAYNPDDNTNQLLNEHSARITCGYAVANIFATGDSTGTLCIWYVAEFKCHHVIKTCSEAIVQIIIYASQVYVRTNSMIFCFNSQTGKKLYEITIISNSIHCSNTTTTNTGLFISTPGCLRLFQDTEQILKFKHNTTRFVTSTQTRFWSVYDRTIQELDINRHVIEWPNDCINWIQNPTFPFYRTWPTNRYMDVFAMSVDEWMPNMSVDWDPPRQWFRHTALRDAIWNWSVVHNIDLANKWMFLSKEKLSLWYLMCVDQLKVNVASYEYSSNTVELLSHTVCNIEIKEKEILEWCWFHHSRFKMKPILMHLSEQDDDETLINIINKNKPSPDAILCLTALSVRLWLLRGYVAVFICMLRAYHAVYPYGPTHETRKAFELIVSHLFTMLCPSTCDIPLQESGYWKQKERFTPNDNGKYIKTDSDEGFIINVVPKEDGTREVIWKPSRREVVLKEQDVKMWEYIHPEGPHTTLECALIMVNNWEKKESVVQWNWFSSEMGAFLAESKLVQVFKKSMRVLSASWDERGASIKTSTQMEIYEEENVCIEIESPGWSYTKDNKYNIAPLKLKICNNISMMSKSLSLKNIDDILNCCPYKTVITEQIWSMENIITAITSEFEYLMVGFQNGSIFEYENLSSFSKPMRFFHGHISKIMSLHILDDHLISMSEEKICVWCLKSGILYFSFESDIDFVTFIPINFSQIWVIEREDCVTACVTATLWDLELKTTTDKITLPSDGRSFYAFKILNMPTLITDSDIIVWSDDDLTCKYNTNMKGNTTCVVPTQHGVCGGTSKGEIFLFDLNNKEMQMSTIASSITAIADIPNTDLIICGSQTGEISLFNTEQNNLDSCVYISNEPILHIHVENMFAIVTYHSSVRLLSVVPERSSLSCHAIYSMMQWSSQWKMRLMQHVKQYIQPTAFFCLNRKKSIMVALDLIDMCTEEYADRTLWCAEEVCDLLLDMPLDASRNILKRLVSFQGPRIDCVICGDDEKKDTVSYLPACHHRFHTGCIAEHIRKTPEYHDEMQYEYALSVELKCPTCREKFKSEDVKLDHILNCT